MSQKSRSPDSKIPICWLKDLDDLLIWTSYAYSIAFREFYDYMLKLFRYRLIEIRTLGTISEKIDLSLRSEMNPKTNGPFGYSRDRFPESLVRTYLWLCEKGFGRYNELVADRVRDTGYRAFDPLLYQEQGLVEGAAEVLDLLQSRGDKLVLLTKGDELVQRTKIEVLGLERWFGPEMHIVDDKTVKLFEAMKKKFSGHKLISVGNSYNSDIKPALEAGIMGVYIPYHTWAAEPEPEQIDTDGVIVIDRIFKIFGLLENGRI